MLNEIFESHQRNNSAIILPLGKLDQFWELFKCKKCGKCCVDLPKGIRISKSELQQLAKLKNLKVTHFKRKYTTLVNDIIRMNYPCPFYKDGCTIYDSRPAVCRYFPLGRSILRNGLIYLTASPHCQGVKEVVGDIA